MGQKTTPMCTTYAMAKSLILPENWKYLRCNGFTLDVATSTNGSIFLIWKNIWYEKNIFQVKWFSIFSISFHLFLLQHLKQIQYTFSIFNPRIEYVLALAYEVFNFKRIQSYNGRVVAQCQQVDSFLPLRPER